MTKQKEQAQEPQNIEKKSGTKDFFDSLIVAFVIAMVIRDRKSTRLNSSH